MNVLNDKTALTGALLRDLYMQAKNVQMRDEDHFQEILQNENHCCHEALTVWMQGKVRPTYPPTFPTGTDDAIMMCTATKAKAILLATY